MLSQFKILLVEDNKEFREIVGVMLRDQFPDARVSEASSCRSAMDILNQEFHNLVFMDIKLPDGIGLDLTRSIKTRFSDTIVVILSANDLPEYREASIDSGATRFLSKRNATCCEISYLVQKFMNEMLPSHPSLESMAA